MFHHCTDAPAPPMRGGPSFGVLQMKRLTAEIGQDYKTDLRLRSDSVAILQHAAEAYLVGLVSEGYVCTIKSDRCMLEPRDIKRVRVARAIWIPPITDSRGSSTVDVHQLVELSTHRGLVKGIVKAAAVACNERCTPWTERCTPRCTGCRFGVAKLGNPPISLTTLCSGPESTPTIKPLTRLSTCRINFGRSEIFLSDRAS